jgi:hypothetical protein
MFRSRIDAALTAARPLTKGRVTGAVGLRVTVSGLEARVGELLRIGSGEEAVLAEVAALDGERLSCLPLGPIAGLGAGSPVVSTGGPLRVAVGPDLRGRILDGLGRPMDGGAAAARRAGRHRRRAALGHGAPAGRPADVAGRTRAGHAGPVRPGAADRHLRGLRRRQVHADEHDHQGHVRGDQRGGACRRARS